ncbi:sugar phosphate isomerase/epimerase [Arsenicicoccus piscis]|uniref:Xylose isomerase-like TIM barrel domain-containing protein n=1 Tax=Arsenicicoccus piscis TaxID=673954 RepID=A0ABQ6HIX2_9MICO|nr:sugar phosphate isomerase/epimerase [Arsenicicoccus piscis]MCH8627672.1 sugar phosphate isomerase/epimerase [Arsenicicoccus piscis]GMA18172.1 hypothetical protein GCM10025862_01930 [Arsenicicoccus piscis]
MSSNGSVTPREERPATVALSSSSVYPDLTEDAFRLAVELGYDGVEVMVYTDPVSQSATDLLRLVERYQMPIVSIHAPTLLLTQRVMHAEPWPKIDLSIDLAHAVGAPTVVAHPPFRWQRVYAREFVDGVAMREDEHDITIAVENMYPWRAGQRAVQAYLPHWDPVYQPYDHVTLDVSHAATAQADSLEMARALGSRLSHVHLTDGTGSSLDEHLVPGRGGQPVAELVGHLAETGFGGAIVIEVSTRKGTPASRRADLAESLRFTREAWAASPVNGVAS